MKLYRSLLFSILAIFFFSCNRTQSLKNVSEVSISNTSLERVEPPNWFVGFKDTSLQLLVKENHISNSKPSIYYAGISIEKVHKAQSRRGGGPGSRKAGQGPKVQDSKR